MDKKITVVILAKNSEQHIERCITSVSMFDEVIIVDNNSDDRTVEICSSFPNVKVFKYTSFPGFGELKNFGVLQASNDWILSIDSDEIVSSELQKEIENLQFDQRNIYGFFRLNHYKGKLVTCCGWGSDFVIRLFNKNESRFNNNKVHESLISKNLNIINLKGKLLHYPFNSIESLIEKMDRYSTLYVNQQKKIKHPVLRAIFGSLFCFIKNYFFQRGILSGYIGFVISVCNASGVFFKYIKAYEKEQE